jgi:predicted O-methyltransferase YrrM
MNSEDAEMIASHQPYSMTELIERFERGTGTGRHLLILYSIAIGLNARTIVDIGTGQTTGALRAAAKKTGGVVYSYDQDARRRQCLLPYQDAQWRLTLEASSTALRHAPSPLDMVMHDGAHDYVNVKRDLELLLPKMRQFGVICVHDTQQPELYKDMLAAITNATSGYKVSLTNLPFNCGLAIIRVEESKHPAISPTFDKLPQGQADTFPVAFVSGAQERVHVPMHRRWLVPIKIKIGHVLRQAGLKR